MSKLIGLTGNMGVGKSTVVQLLRDMPRLNIEVVKFAEPLYDIQEYAYRRISNAHTRPSNFVKDRKLLQFLGTDWGRNSISETIWVDLWKDQVNYILENSPETIVICDDVRFDNEADAVAAMGGHVIKIVSDKAEKRIDTRAGFSGHSSEAGVALNKVEYIIENNSTIDELRTSLYTLNTKLALW